MSTTKSIVIDEVRRPEAKRVAFACKTSKLSFKWLYSKDIGREWVGFRFRTTPGRENTRKRHLFIFSSRKDFFDLRTGPLTSVVGCERVNGSGDTG